MVAAKLSGKAKAPTRARKVLNGIVTGVLTVVLVTAVSAMLYLIIQLIQGKSPTLFGYRFYYVLTDSMEPYLKPADVILSKSVEGYTAEEIKSLLKEGDIITYRGIVGGREAMITHRVTNNQGEVVFFDEISEKWMVQTKGDNNTAFDSPMEISRISAVMVSKVDIIGWLYSSITTPLGVIFFIGLPSLFIITIMILRIVKIALAPPAPVRAANAETDAETERQIALNAVEEYKLEERKKQIAEQAVREYLDAQNKLK